VDALWLSRIQFAMTVGFHFLFPPITIGLAWLLVYVEWRAWKSADVAWQAAGLFFGRLLALTFAIGVAAGIVMEFQFGTNWATYSRFVGDIFGAPLAAEGVFAFFLESGFLGLYLFGRNRVSRGLHWFAILMVAIGSTLSAFWILVANSWQQTPAGFVLNEATGRAELTDFAAAVFNPSTMPRFWHTLAASVVTGSFFMAGVSALLLLRKIGREVAARTLKVGLAAGLVSAIAMLFPTGHEHGRQVASTQPEKFAALEGVYESYPEGGVPMVLFALVQTSPPYLQSKVEIPGLLSLLSVGDLNAPVRGLKEFPPDRVPQGAELWLSFVSFHNMILLGMLFIAVMVLAGWFWWRGTLMDRRWFLWVLVIVSPLPLAACEFGWVAAEVGRQPWIVYGLLRTADAASKTVSAAEVLASIILFGLIYLALGALWVFLMWKKIVAGPEASHASEVA